MESPRKHDRGPEQPRKNGAHPGTADQRQRILDALLAKHRDMMASPERWPVYPFLALRNDRRIGSDGFPALGLLYDAKGAFGKDGLQTTVFLVNLLSIGGAIRTEADFLRQPRETYPSLDGLLADGWGVD